MLALPAVQQELASMRAVQQQLECLYSWRVLDWLWSTLLPHSPAAHSAENELLLLEKVLQQLRGEGDYCWDQYPTRAALDLLTASIQANRYAMIMCHHVI